MSKKIKLYMLSGFLGAGKTTFLTSVLNDIADKKVGVIMNEFGKISIDGEIIKKDGMELVEINRGSIFCSCLKLSFVDTMCTMCDMDLDYLFVESSGLADPSNVDDILFGVKHKKGDFYEYKGIVSIVDALHFFDQLEDLETVERQIKHCHLAVINKTDLVDKETVEKIKEKITEINPKAAIQEAAFGKFNYDFLNEDLLQNQWAESEETTNTKENKPKTLMLTYEDMVNKEDLTKFLEEVSKHTFRMKGFVKLDDGWNQVDVVNRKIDYKPCDEKPEGSQLVLISKIGPAVIKPAMETWKELIPVEMKLKN
ncbi:CobW family GTP-binding protein [Oceanirhabdus seepicola]|uniref:GTP-binding protein n=1 Tax=Oceanirhabdus seepicola TaxID=2828781 RepID=A0A9J6NYG4_9CLOT|nr:GTP-binding protein [Oceanirhabdus seepicola]MCM1988937.1 GTP-binding protein [Oceanirhabdus seepicola]